MPEDLDGQPADLLHVLGSRGHHELHPAVGVLGLVVVPVARPQDDLPRSRRHRVAVAEHRALDLDSLHHPLDHHDRVVLEGQRKRALELLGSRGLRYPHRRSEPGRLDEDRQREVESRAPAVARHRVVDLRDRVRGHQILEQRLVHRQRRRQHARTHVGDVEQVEQALNGAVLAEGPVQGREDRVGVEQPARRGQRESLPVVRPAPIAVDPDVDRLVPAFGQTGPHRLRRGQGYVVLAGTAAREDGDPHGAASGAPGVITSSSTSTPTMITTSRPFSTSVPAAGR